MKSFFSIIFIYIILTNLFCKNMESKSLFEFKIGKVRLNFENLSIKFDNSLELDDSMSTSTKFSTIITSADMVNATTTDWTNSTSTQNSLIEWMINKHNDSRLNSTEIF